MSLDKGIRHGKEHRRDYHGSARFDRTCRPHGSCGFCQGNRSNRQHQKLKKAQREIQDEHAHRQRKDVEDRTDVRQDP